LRKRYYLMQPVWQPGLSFLVIPFYNFSNVKVCVFLSTHGHRLIFPGKMGLTLISCFRENFKAEQSKCYLKRLSSCSSILVVIFILKLITWMLIVLFGYGLGFSFDYSHLGLLFAKCKWSLFRRSRKIRSITVSSLPTY